MSSLDFGTFLNKMSGETNNTKKVKRRPIEEEYIPQREKQIVNKSRSVVPTDIPPTPKKERQVNKINEDFHDRAYDYSQSVIKLIRDNFKSIEERTLMFESLINAINYYMGRNTSQPTQKVQESSPMFDNSGAVMSEDEWNKMGNPMSMPGNVQMNDLTGQNVVPTPVNSKYKTNLNLGIKITPDGKQEADLSGITAMDINEMKILAGMIGPEADNKTKELNAAKQEIAQKLANKTNMGN